MLFFKKANFLGLFPNSKYRNISLFLCVIALKPHIRVDFFSRLNPKTAYRKTLATKAT